MSGLLDQRPLERVFNAWRRVLRLDPLLSRVPMPELRPFAEAFNLALTGEDDGGDLAASCDELVRNQLEPNTVIRITTVLAETFTDEVGATSGAVTKSLVGTLGHVCGLLTTTMVADEREVARRDALTALENRLAWDEALLDDAQIGHDVAVSMLDLDGLKQVNDTHGHLEGNRYLQKFAADLVQALPEGATPYRLGGDEYAVRWPAGSDEGLKRVLETLRDTDGVAPFSFGIAEASQGGLDPEALTNIADERMYEMKRSRKAVALTQEHGDTPLPSIAPDLPLPGNADEAS